MFFSPFFFVLGILVIVFVFAGYAMHRDHAFKLQREQIRAGNEGSSLGTSELRELIQDAMTEAMTPVEARLTRIEGQLRQLPERAAGTIDLDPEVAASEESEATATRSRSALH